MNGGVKQFGLVVAVGVAAAGLLYHHLGIGDVQAQSGTRRGGAYGSRTGSGYQGGTAAQGYSRRRTQSRSAGAEQPFEERFWNWLESARYQNWGPMPGQSDDFYPGNSPHGAFVKLYCNRPAAGNPDDLPHGSILVKENFGPDKKNVMAITVMYRVKDYDPEHGDWYWAKYEPDGRVSQMKNMSIAGKVAMCAECHSGADGNDFTFANDAN